nr:MAG TPA: hypothetical protein [Caudoviricetes sp.]
MSVIALSATTASSMALTQSRPPTRGSSTAAMGSTM